jgi:hypothetical protein
VHTQVDLLEIEKAVAKVVQFPAVTAEGFFYLLKEGGNRDFSSSPVYVASNYQHPISGNILFFALVPFLGPTCETVRLVSGSATIKIAPVLILLRPNIAIALLRETDSSA